MNETIVENSKETSTAAQNVAANEPVDTTADNSHAVSQEMQNQNGIVEADLEGQSAKKDPSAELILGKFKSVDELSKAYEELQKYQGKTSEELGNLRKELSLFSSFKELTSSLENYKNAITSIIEKDKQTYNTVEYLQNPVFKEIYSEALMTFGDNLDTDRLVNLLEKYVNTRIQSHDKEAAANLETRSILSSMEYSKNPEANLKKREKPISDMSEEEFRESIRKLI